MGMESINSIPNEEQPRVLSYKDILEYTGENNHSRNINKIEARIQAIKDGTAKSVDGSKYSDEAVPVVIQKLEDMKVQFQKAAEEGKISKELLDQIYSF